MMFFDHAANQYGPQETAHVLENARELILRKDTVIATLVNDLKRYESWICANIEDRQDRLDLIHELPTYQRTDDWQWLADAMNQLAYTTKCNDPAPCQGVDGCRVCHARNVLRSWGFGGQS